MVDVLIVQPVATVVGATAPLTLTGTSDTPQLVVRANASQTSALQQWQKGDGTTVLSISGDCTSSTWGVAGDQVLSNKYKVTTTDATLTTIATISAAVANTQYGVDVVIQAHSGANAAKWNLSNAFLNNAGTIVTEGATTSSDPRGTSAGAPPATWPTPVVTFSGTNILVQVQGPAATTIVWTAIVQIVQTA